MIKLYTSFHKPFIVPSSKYVIPIQGGKAIAKTQLEMIGDDTGENISYLNPYFSELTVLYWVVKNAERNCEAWGLCHYRRYFMHKKKIFGKTKSDYRFHPSEKNINAVLNEKLFSEIENIFETYDAIVQIPKLIHKRKGVIKNLEENYVEYHPSHHWQIVKDVLFEKYPNYKESWEPFCQLTKISFYNMMIAKWNVWDAYADWIFDILLEVWKRIEHEPEENRSRILGFMSERLMNLFLIHNKIKTAYLPIATFDK